ncbi:MAG: HNH endonuclease [Sphingopyxis solisilvae]|uniref:HNH endonuclease n=1 Tax=Sphingopyxis solisilvae TaxID=1886788 RepID=UPI0040357974
MQLSTDSDMNGMSFRRSLLIPIPEIFLAAEQILRALEKHACGEKAEAEHLLQTANIDVVRAYTEQAWGRGATARYGFVTVADAPPRLSPADRPKPRMPDSSTRAAVISRDGYHCRFCGIPVVDATLRRLIAARYPAAVGWGSTNNTQHAAFQCMWLQFDHILPNSRGGSSLVDNVVIACAACNFGRMETTLEEARLLHPLEFDPPILWERHEVWDGLERFRAQLQSG